MVDQAFTAINIAEIQMQLPTLSNEIIEELYRFGALVLSDAQQRSARLDAKLTLILGCSSAMLALLLLNGNAPKHGIRWSFYLGTITVATLSVAFCYFALKSKRIFAMSEADWFRDGLLNHVETLKRYHIISMLQIHQVQLNGNLQKSRMLRFAEVLMALSALGVYAILLFRLF